MILIYYFLLFFIIFYYFIININKNYYKKISGQKNGAENFELLKTEKAKWDNFFSFVEKNASDKESDYLNELLALIDATLQERLSRRYYGKSSLIAMAQRLYRNAAEKEKSLPLRHLLWTTRS